MAVVNDRVFFGHLVIILGLHNYPNAKICPESCVYGMFYSTYTYTINIKYSCKIYPSSHNHGSVENGCISNMSCLSFRLIFLLHDYLTGGFKHFLFSSLFGEMIQFDSYFSDGLKPPTSYGRKDESTQFLWNLMAMKGRISNAPHRWFRRQLGLWRRVVWRNKLSLKL